MPETRQINFTHSEVLKLLVKSAGVHEGLWALSFNLGMLIGRIQSDPETAFPGASVLIQSVGIQRMEEGAPIVPGSTYVDAAEVNPKAEGKKEE